MDLGFSATAVMQHITQGRRPLSPKAAEKIVKALKLRSVERRYLLLLVEYCNTNSNAARERAFDGLLELKDKVLASETDRNELEYFTKWYHVIIGEMTRLAGFDPDPAQIAKALLPTIRPEQVKASLSLLKQLGIIDWSEEKKTWIRADKSLSTGHEARGHAIQGCHQQMIDLGREALTKVTQKERDISTMTLCLTAEGFQKVKAMIHSFQMQVLTEEARTGMGEQICQLNLQFFPFTKKLPDDEPK